MLFDAEGRIKRYDSPEEILTEFFDLRLQYYERRRVSMLQVSNASMCSWNPANLLCKGVPAFALLC